MTGIKRGVSLYSLQDAYGRGGLGLEGVIDAVERMGAQGVEILSDQMITGAQRATEETLSEWDRIMDPRGLERVCNDIFINSSVYRNRWLTIEEQVASLEADLRLAHRLGFPLVRLVSRTDPAVIRPTLALARELGVTMAVEVHAGMSFDHPLTSAWVDEMRALDDPRVGLVVDLGIFCHRHPRVSSGYFRALGVDGRVIDYIDAIFDSGTDPKHAFEATSTADSDSYDYPEDLRALFRNPIDEFFAMMATGYENTPLEVLDSYLPYVKSFHGKFWEMTDDGEEYSIDYGRIFRFLRQRGFEGYVCSEYEGQRFVLPGEPVNDIEQVGRHQALLDRLIREGE